ncbi:predicted protein [Uncinocarpus reesii 1704]|uniref:Uncharacterized protein n=1 Tax=Uncinocarpus reesii (strain UAMH 1704) TaxID=336963 RepID=C4JD96_UNCRE|nr:uncharacterized protein UREG_00291 [Uncinocarpus reesii 1704]EEP75445.1 predicted protein [Uncinocarpus reesii 1704]
MPVRTGLARMGTGLAIYLHYLDVEYDIHLGTLLAVWTTHISPIKPPSKTGVLRIKTSICPETDRWCCVRVLKNDLGEVGRVPGDLTGLTRLKDVAMAGAGDGVKVLVYVKAIGITQQASQPQKRGELIERCDIGIADDSGEAILTLKGYLTRSARKWVPNSTILLLSDVFWGSGTRRAYVSAQSTVEVDPDMKDADWLRRYSKGMAGYVNERFPENGRVSARVTPEVVFMGYVCVMIMEVNLVELFRNNRLFYTECCNMPIFASSTHGQCGQCEQDIELKLNPRIIGSLADETGCISCTPFQTSPAKKQSLAIRGSSPLLWSPTAWSQLLGREPAALLQGRDAAQVGQELLVLETLMLFSRITVLFGWSREVGKLAVCEVLGS